MRRVCCSAPSRRARAEGNRHSSSLAPHTNVAGTSSTSGAVQLLRCVEVVAGVLLKTRLQRFLRDAASPSIPRPTASPCRTRINVSRNSSSVAFHAATLRCWRLQPKPRSVMSARCAASDVGQSGKNSFEPFECRQSWYQRQLHAHTLFPVDLIPLAQRMPMHGPLGASLITRDGGAERPSARHADAMTAAFLSCCASPLCDSAVLQSIFSQLTADQQCSILCRCQSHDARQYRALTRQCVEQALSRSGFSAAHWICVLSSVRDTSLDHPFPVPSIMTRVFESQSSAFASPEDGRAFIAKALALMEQRNTPCAQIVDCLTACGLHYEACAYASSSSSFVHFEVLPAKAAMPASAAELDGMGYGPVMTSMCALPKPPLQWFRTLRAAMPPTLQRYSTLVLFHAAVRRSGGVVSAEDDTWRKFTPDLLSPLEAASALHFLLGEGNALTARLLLDHCYTVQQVLTLMRYTHGAHSALTFRAVERILMNRTEERLIIHLRLESRGRRSKLALLFDAQPGGCEEAVTATTRGHESPESHQGEWLMQTLSLSSFDRNHVYQYLHDALPRSVLARGERSLAQMLAAIPPAAVDHVATSLPTMHGDALSWWVSLYVAGGNVDGAVAVLRVIAERGCLPHMGVLVELLEATQDDTAKFVHAVTVVRQWFPTVAATVLRAFVERAAAAAVMPMRTATPATVATQATHALKALAVVGLPHLYSRCLSDVAAHDAPDTLLAVMSLAQELCGCDAHSRGIAPLDVAAIRGLAEAGRQLKYRVCVSAIAVSADGSFVGWWGASARPLQSLARVAYSSLDLSLWPWVREEARSSSSSRFSYDELHKAVRVVALGSLDAVVALAFWDAMAVKIMAKCAEVRMSRKVSQARIDSEAYTVACLYAVCRVQKQHQLASQLLQRNARCGRLRSSPLLNALSDFDSAAVQPKNESSYREMLADDQGKALLRRRRQETKFGGCRSSGRRRHSLLTCLPPTLQRLVCASGPEIVDALAAPAVLRKGKVKDNKSGSVEK